MQWRMFLTSLRAASAGFGLFFSELFTDLSKGL
jgi:hypothetical protein